MKAAAGFFDNRMQGNDNEASCLAARTIYEEGGTRLARRGRTWKLSSRRLRGARLVGLRARLGSRDFDWRDQSRLDRWQFTGNARRKTARILAFDHEPAGVGRAGFRSLQRRGFTL